MKLTSSVYTYNGILLSNKKKWIIFTSNNKDKTQMHLNQYTIYGSISMSPEKVKLLMMKKQQWLPGVKDGERA